MAGIWRWMKIVRSKRALESVRKRARVAPWRMSRRPLPFSAFEWLLSGRYLRARRKEGFISVIAGFSFLGIMLGVATLIIVMAVMNGFRKELIDKIVGMNGHLVVQPIEVAADGLAGRHRAHPSGSGHTACRSRGGRSGAGVVGAKCLRRAHSRHSRRRSQPARLGRQQYPAGFAGGIRAGTGRRHRTPACRTIVAACRRPTSRWSRLAKP